MAPKGGKKGAACDRVVCSGPDCAFVAVSSPECDWKPWGCDCYVVAAGWAMCKHKTPTGDIEYYCQRCVRKDSLITKVAAYGVEDCMAWSRGGKTTEAWIQSIVCSKCHKFLRAERKKFSELEDIEKLKAAKEAREEAVEDSEDNDDAAASPDPVKEAFIGDKDDVVDELNALKDEFMRLKNYLGRNSADGTRTRALRFESYDADINDDSMPSAPPMPSGPVVTGTVTHIAPPGLNDGAGPGWSAFVSAPSGPPPTAPAPPASAKRSGWQ